MATDNNNKILNVPNKGNAPKIRFPEFTSSWKKVRLKDECSFFSGGTPTSTVKEYYDGDIPFIRSGEINSDITELYISEEGLNNSSAKYVEQGDLLLALYGATSGMIGISKIKGAINQAILCIRTSNNKVFLKSVWEKHVKQILQAYLQGGQGNLSADIVKKLQFNIPTKEEQEKICNFITLIDQRIATQNKIIEDLKKLKVAICNKLIDTLVNREPLIHYSEAYSKAGEGGTPETSKSEYYENGNIPFIKIDDLSNKYITSNKDYITDLGLQKSSAWIIPTHSLIYSNGATIGAISINTYEVCTKQGILGIVPKSTISVEYLYCLMSSNYFTKQVHRIITHGTMATAYLKDINMIKVPIPCMSQQLEIANIVSSVTDKIETELNILSLLLKQKQYLLQQMFI